MKGLKKIFWLALGILSPAPALALYFYGNFYDLLEPYSLGMIFGITAYIYFANVLIISARIRYFDRIFGHDRVMQYHGITAFIALIFSLVHRQLKALVFDDLSFLQPTLGQIALLIFLSIISLTLLFMVPGLIHRFQPLDALRVFVNRKLALDYSILKVVHNLLAGTFAVLLVHIFLASSTGETLSRMLFMALWGGVALSLWVYHKLIRPLFLHARSLRVSSVIQHSDTVTEIRMVSPSGALPRYRAGQFAFLRFPASAVGGEEHPFTLSSSPDESFIAITAKDLGNYTGKLRLLKEGDSAHLDGPYGVFTLDSEEKGPLLFIAGGIGITPFYSIIKTIAGDDERTIFLFWAVRKREDLIYDADFRALTSRIKIFHYIPVLSDEEPRDSEEKGFITSELLRKYCGPLASYRVYFCGPQVMRRSVFRELGKDGVPERMIRYEQFSLG